MGVKYVFSTGYLESNGYRWADAVKEEEQKKNRRRQRRR
jgi:hypothetical protein